MGNFIILEGIDKCGKSTVANILEQQYNYTIIKDKWLSYNNEHMTEMRAYEKILSMVMSLKDVKGNFVIDRLHLSQWAYGLILRDDNDVDTFKQIDKTIKELLNPLIVFIKQENLLYSIKADDRDDDEKNKLPEIQKELIFIIQKTVCDTLVVSNNNGKADIYDIIAMQCVFRNSQTQNLQTKHSFRNSQIYLASPFFTPEQVEREERIKSFIREINKNNGIKLFSPKENCFVQPDGGQEQRKKAFDDNCTAIQKSCCVVAITDGKDVGTIWEAGYAYALGIPIIYYCETLPKGGQFNLMLAQSGIRVCTQMHELREAILGFTLGLNVKQEYKGGIE